MALCISTGMNPKFIQNRLGHSSIRVTMDSYGHLLESLLDQEMASLNVLGAESWASWRVGYLWDIDDPETANPR